MIPVTKSYLPSLEDYTSQLERIWQGGILTNNGLLIKELADKLNQHLNTPNIELVANGTLALQLAIKALGLKGEVITTPFSYVATTTALIWENCTPIFVDIEERTFCIDADKIEAAITEQTSAILATHVYGYPCNVKKIEEIAKKHDLKVIYDGAHAFGVKLNGKSIFDYGDVSTLSFHATKLFHTIEGGALVCRDKELVEKINLMKKFGHMGEEKYLEVGINAKMSEVHAAMGLCVLPKLNESIANRRAISEHYDDLLKGCGLSLPQISVESEYNYAYFPIVFATHTQMMQVRQSLIDNNIMPRRYFYPSLNTLKYLGLKSKQKCPISESISERVLCLPLYHDLELKSVDKICSVISKELK